MLKKITSLSCILFTFISLVTFADAKDMSDEINSATSKIMPKIIKWRRHIHENPELSNREFKTAEMVANHLRSLGMEVKTGIAKTGVVGILKGNQPGPTIGLRADMDALPVKERVDIPFASKVIADYNGMQTPVMHACGHDSHVAMLMGTAEVLAGMKDKIKGTVVFIFQPAEEGPPEGERGGAKLMVEEGVMTNPKIDAVFGIHINSQTEIGTIRYKKGATMAASDWFKIKIKGKQAHGSAPWAGVDPIVTATMIISGLQTIVSRQSVLTKAPVVITVGKINAGVRENIIPETLEMAGTIRTLDSEMQKDVHRRIRNTVKAIAESQGATAEVEIDTKTLVTFNTPDLVEKMLPSLEKSVGKANVIESEWTTGAEDFSYFGTKAPSFYFFVGGMPKGMNPNHAAGHHTPDFYLDDSRLDVGVKAFANIVFDYSK
jgi:amidohydrolase